MPDWHKKPPLPVIKDKCLNKSFSSELGVTLVRARNDELLEEVHVSKARGPSILVVFSH